METLGARARGVLKTSPAVRTEGHIEVTRDDSAANQLVLIRAIRFE